MNIGNINSLRGPEEVSSVRSTPVLKPMPLAGSSPLPSDSVRVAAGTQESQPVGDAKPLSQAREAFKVNLANLKGQNEDDKNAIRDIARSVDERPDLNSKEKEWLFATEMGAYTADAAMTMTSLEKKGQPWTQKQQERFDALIQTYGAAKGVAEAVTPMVARPDSGTPSVEAGAAAGTPVKAAAPLTPAPLQPAVPLQPAPSLAAAPLQPAPAGLQPAPTPASSGGAQPPADPNAPPANTPPAPPKDPLVAIWESRRQEAQDVFNDYKALMQKIADWKARIIASRIAFFWKVYGAHTNFLSDGWKK
ncbi:MAG: hypothetical protein U0931_03415 [Vulcanimicrobiota bacterium]